MSASEASNDDNDEYAPGHMPVPDFEALARDIQKRVSRRVGASPARRPGGAGAMDPSPDEVCVGGSGTRPFGSRGRHCHTPVHEGALGDPEGGGRRGRDSNRERGGSQGGRRTGTSWRGRRRRWCWVLLDVLLLRQIP